MQTTLKPRSSAGARSSIPGKGLCLLSLDGGGVRGLSSLFILKRLMELIDHEDPPKPCDYFDLIGGTSTGGLIAIMLGRLQMSVDDCIKAYGDLSDKVFTKCKHRMTWRGTVQGRFDHEALVTEIQALLRSKGHSEDTLLKDPKGYKGCRTFVCTVGEQVDDLVIFPSFYTRRWGSDMLNTIKIWQAARATSAATSFFDPFEVEGERFIDGATRANNPVFETWIEADNLFRDEGNEDWHLSDDLLCLVSIGTGRPSVRPFGDSLGDIGKSLLKLATDTEATAERFERQNGGLFKHQRAFRFNVSHGLESIGLEAADQLGNIKAATRRYLAEESVLNQATSCSLTLKQRESSQAGQVALIPFVSENGDVFTSLVKRPEWKIDVQGQRPYNIFEHISDYEPSRIYRGFLRKRCRKTATWVLQNESCQAWLDGAANSCLWLSGKIGCGKTIAATSVIEEALRRSLISGNPVCHFYYTHKSPSRLKATDLFESLIKQMLGYLDLFRKPCPLKVVNSVKQCYIPTKLRPAIDEIVDDICIPLLKALSDVVIIVDGLDECAEHEVNLILQMIRRICQNPSHKPRVLLSGRRELHITDAIPGSVLMEASAAEVSGDIQRYVRWRIEEKMLERRLTEDDGVLKGIEAKLTEQSDRMILWVELQLEALWQDCTTDSTIWEALEKLPSDLPQTYQWCLDRISNRDRALAARILRWLTVTIEPFTIDQLREALAIDMEHGRIGCDLLPEQLVLQSCRNLVIKEDDGRVFLAHFSVRQFLASRQEEALYPWYSLFSPGSPLFPDLELAEICTRHLTSSTYSLDLQTASATSLSIEVNAAAIDRITQNVPRWPWSNASKPKSRRVVVPVGRPKPTQERPTFFYFARKNWAPLTAHMDHSLEYEWSHLFRRLALEPNLTFRLHPWEPLGVGVDSHCVGLLGWAIANAHYPLFSLLSRSTSKKRIREIFGIPLPHRGNLPAFHLACRLGRVEFLPALLSYSSLKAKDLNKRTVVHHAAETNQLRCLLWLKEKARISSDVLNAQDSDRRTALHLAAASGHWDVVKLLLLLKADLNLRDGRDMTALETASQAGHLSVVQELIASSAKGDPLQFAIAHAHEPIVQSLASRHSADQSKGKRPHDRDLLMLALEHGNIAIIKMLIEFNKGNPSLNDHSSANRLTRPGYTPLTFAAAITKSADQVEMLLISPDIDVNSRSTWAGKENALHIAARLGLEAIVAALLGHPDIGVNTQTTDDQKTPLHLAVQNGRGFVAESLLAHRDIEVNLQDSDGCTAITLALENSTSIMELLLVHPFIEVNQTIDFGDTLLSRAVVLNNVHAVKLLLAATALDVNKTGRSGATPLSLAIALEFGDIVELLLAHPAIDITQETSQDGLTWHSPWVEVPE